MMRAIVAATSAAVVVALVGGPAQALSPVPVAAVPLPVELDNAAFYEAQTICDPTPRPGSTALKDLLVATYGPATVYIPRACTSSTSEHFDGRAVDWMRSVRVPAEKEMADSFVNWLLAPAKDGTPHAMARRLGIMYIIWNNRMIRMYDPGRGWTNYRNCCSDQANSGTSLDTSCHRNRVHFSMSWDGAAAMTSWWSVLPRCSPSALRHRLTAGAGQPRVVAAGVALPGMVAVEPAKPSWTRGRARVPDSPGPAGSWPDAPSSRGRPSRAWSRTARRPSCSR